VGEQIRFGKKNLSLKIAWQRRSYSRANYIWLNRLVTIQNSKVKSPYIGESLLKLMVIQDLKALDVNSEEI